MDRAIEKKKGMALVFSKKALPYWGGGLLALLGWRTAVVPYRIHPDKRQCKHTESECGNPINKQSYERRIQ